MLGQYVEQKLLRVFELGSIFRRRVALSNKGPGSEVDSMCLRSYRKRNCTLSLRSSGVQEFNMARKASLKQYRECAACVCGCLGSGRIAGSATYTKVETNPVLYTHGVVSKKKGVQ